jgi:hypothetical protein
LVVIVVVVVHIKQVAVMQTSKLMEVAGIKILSEVDKVKFTVNSVHFVTPSGLILP